MKVNIKMINPELRRRGRIFKLFSNSTYNKKSECVNSLLRVACKGRCFSKIGYRQEYIKRLDGTDLRICIYTPLEEYDNVPGVLIMHGGGYAVGIAENSETFAKQLINRAKCVVISPDYTQSTKAPYPKALEDCYLALKWLKDNSKRLNVRSDQIMIGGESAGAGLAIALALYNRDKGDVAIAYQMPIYPMIDDRMLTDSMIDNDAPAWNYKKNEAAWKLYLQDLFNKDDVPYYASPSRCNCYKDLPPACTFVGSLEPFKDETIEYMKRLEEENIEVKYKVFEGCFHAFDHICYKSKIAKEAIKFKLDCFEFATNNYFKEQKR